MKSNPSTWMPLYVGDYLRDTGHLSTAEHGAYFLMLMHAWTHGGELPADPPRLCIITKLNAKEWRHSNDVLMAFFQRNGGVLRHKRLDHELANATTMTEQRRIAGRHSAERRGRHKVTPPETPHEPPTEDKSMNVDTCERSANGQRDVEKTPEKNQRNARPSPSPSPKKKERVRGLRPLVAPTGDATDLPPAPDRPPDEQPAKAGPTATAILDWAVTVWNRVCGAKLTPVVKVTRNRSETFMRRWREDFHEDAEAWERYCQRVVDSPFLTNAQGKNRADWRANFDFVLAPRNFVRIEEGLWDADKAPRNRGKFAWLEDPPIVDPIDPVPEFDLEMTPDEHGTFRPN